MIRRWLRHMLSKGRIGYVYLAYWAVANILAFAVLRLLGAIFPSMHHTAWHDAENVARTVTTVVLLVYFARRFNELNGWK